MEHGPRNDKKIKNSEQFQKCTQKAQRGHDGKCGIEMETSKWRDQTSGYRYRYVPTWVNLQVYPSK